MKKTTKKTAAKKTTTPEQIAKALRAALNIGGISAFQAEQAHTACLLGYETLEERAEETKGGAAARRHLRDQAKALRALATALEAEGINR